MFPPIALILAFLAITASLPTEPQCANSADAGPLCGKTGSSSCVQREKSLSYSAAYEDGGQQKQPVHAVLSEDGLSATVSLLSQSGQILQTYHMHSTDVTSKGADLQAIVDGVSAQLSSAGRFFSSDQPGKLAKASWQGDGHVLGLFQHAHNILRVMPMEGNMAEGASPFLLETEARLHYIEIANVNVNLNSGSEDPQDGELGAEQDGGDVQEIVDEDHGDPSVLAPANDDLLPSQEIGMASTWKGEKWFPGCFPEDGKKHIMRIGVAADVEASKDMGDRTTLQTKLEQIVHESNIIFENQLNIQVQIGTIRIYEGSNTSQPEWAQGCHSPSSREMMVNKYEQFEAGTQEMPQMAAWHLFTGCGTGSGVVGLAALGAVCLPSHNAGVSQLRNDFGLRNVVEKTWDTFAHELGHNFGAEHSFEKGEGRTGGIMDYGDGKLNGVYQFNTRYRKEEVCSHLSSVKQGCGANFIPMEGATLAPTPAPTPSPPPAVVQDCSFENSFCFWTNAADDYVDWIRNSGKTPTTSTGPSKAAEGNYYLFMEASHPAKPGYEAILRSPRLMISQPMVMKFQYHMYGEGIGSLRVNVNGNELWSEQGNKGDRWLETAIDLNQFKGSTAVIDIVGVRGESFKSDIAIDMVSFEVPTAEPTPTTATTKPQSPAPTPVPTPMPTAASTPVPTPILPTTSTPATLPTQTVTLTKPTTGPIASPACVGDCLYCKPHQEVYDGIAAHNMPLCANGEYTWDCHEGNRGGRVQCPLESPMMCAKKSCDEGQDYCCEKDCGTPDGPFGGPRLCN